MLPTKVKSAMGFQKSPSTPKQQRSTTPLRSSSSGSFSKYFPRSSSSSSSAQINPRPSSSLEKQSLLRLVDDLREKESLLRTQLLEHKLLKESLSIVPFLEQELQASKSKIADLEAENEELRRELEEYKAEEEVERRIDEMESEIESLKRAVADTTRFQTNNKLPQQQKLVLDECSSTRKFRLPLVASSKTPRLQRVGSNPEIFSRKETADVSETMITALKSRTPRVPKPPPTPTPTPVSSSSSYSSSSSSASSCCSSSSSVSSSETPRGEVGPPVPPPEPPKRLGGLKPPPPPPPPPVKGFKTAAKVRRVPEVVEFYHSLMRRESKRECGSGATEVQVASAANTKDMIGEIENRSAYLLAIKTEVETQGDFIRFLIKEVENAAFTNIEDVVAFVKWLDDELSFLVDERAVLKHFEWPEKKADAMREAAFGYNDLKKIVCEASSFIDDPHQHCSGAMKKMQTFLEKLEHGVYNLSRLRESAMKRYKAFRIPWEWMLDTGLVAQVKLASVKLAMKYVKRVSAQMEVMDGDPEEEEELLVQGVRFAFRVHQFAGGFDVETMRAFQELKDKAQNNHPQKLFSRSTTC